MPNELSLPRSMPPSKAVPLAAISLTNAGSTGLTAREAKDTRLPILSTTMALLMSSLNSNSLSRSTWDSVVVKMGNGTS